MKRHFALLFTALFALASCSDDKTEPVTPRQEPVTVTFGASDPTRTTRADLTVDEAAGKFRCDWQSGDRITVFANNQTARFDYNPATSLFEGRLLDNSSSWNFQAVLPHVADTPTRIPFGGIRTQQGNRFNALFYPLVSTLKHATGSVNGTPVTFDFRSLTAILSLSFHTADAAVKNEKVRSIRLTAEGDPLAADYFEIDRNTLTGRLSTSNPRHEILLNYAPGTEPSAADAKAFFNLPQGTYRRLRAEITTERHHAVLDLSAEATFKAGELVYATRNLTEWTPDVEVTIGNINLWKNTATATLKNAPSTARLQYKRTTETLWQTATGTGSQRMIEPRWTNSADGTMRPDRLTGVFARADYDWQLIDQGKVLRSGRFSSNHQGDPIPTLSDGSLSCYTTANTNSSFWSSGNNSQAKTLCTYRNTYAHLQASAVNIMGIIKLLTPGNLFTGTFAMNGTNGTANFGQPYTYTARPTALRVNYRAKTGNVTHNKHASHIAVGQPDEAMIMVCIIDWAQRHATTSGMAKPTGVWNPETLKGLSSAETVIASGVRYIRTGSQTDLEIPLRYFRKTDTAPAGRYTIVISCATSRYGEYLNGCSTNELDIKGLEWVY